MVKHLNQKGELALVDRIRRMSRSATSPGLALGIGDDCAIFRPRAGEELLFTTDMLIEGRHFLRHTHRAQDVGWKALARGLSDIAAMGGVPRFCLVSLALPEWADQAFVDGFYRGLLRLGAAKSGAFWQAAIWLALRRSSATSWCAARRLVRARCAVTPRGPGTLSISQARWAVRHWGWRSAAARPCAGIYIRSRVWRSDGSCAPACAPQPQWILATGCHLICTAWP